MLLVILKKFLSGQSTSMDIVAICMTLVGAHVFFQSPEASLLEKLAFFGVTIRQESGFQSDLIQGTVDQQSNRQSKLQIPSLTIIIIHQLWPNHEQHK